MIVGAAFAVIAESFSLGYALGLSRDSDVPVPVTALVHEIFKAARARGDNKKSQSVMVRLWDDLLGQEVK
jgi:3-hydroxyisobutyrate dehydrogenase-like beta-hydroxyacid dehydrogenase